MSKILFKVPILAESSVNYFSVYFIILFVNPVGRYFELLIFPKVMSFHWGFLLDFMKNHFHTPFCKEGNSVAHGTVFERWDNFQWCFQSTPLVLDSYNSFLAIAIWYLCKYFFLSDIVFFNSVKVLFLCWDLVLYLSSINAKAPHKNWIVKNRI